MITCFKEFVSRHKKKIIVVGVVVGSAIIGTRYAQKKIIEWQEKETQEFIERTRKQHYFESIEKTCNQTIISLSSTLRQNIFSEVDCEEVIRKLRENPSNKIELWQELKLLVFTRVCLMVYSGSLLVIALRIQLNMIGGHIYSNSSAPGNDFKTTNDVQENYLSLSHHFLNVGLKELCPLISEKVQVALKDITLTQSLSLQHIENLFWAIQTNISNDPRNPVINMAQLLYGSDILIEDPFIKEMMLDTTDLLESQEVVDVATSCVNRGFAHVIDRLSEFYTPEENGAALQATASTSRGINGVKFTHPNNLTKPFAKIIPLVNGFGKPTTSGVAESWIAPFIYLDRVKTLGANIYESYSCCKK